MMKIEIRFFRRYILIAGILWLAVITGCGTTQPPQFYMLTSIENINDNNISSTSNLIEKRIGLGPIDFPRYLDRSAIVVRLSDSEISINEAHRWAEPLENNFTQVLLGNLRVLSSNIVLFPSRNIKDIDYQVLIDVFRFDADIKNNVVLSTQWTIRRKYDGTNLYSQKSLITEQAENNSYAAFVKKQSELIKKLSYEIANKLEEVSAKDKSSLIKKSLSN